MRKVTVPEGKKGPWEINKFEIDDKPSIYKMRLAMEGRPVKPGTYTRLVHDDIGVMMSDTPAEMRDHFEFCYQAKGHCLIAGLGLGMCLNEILHKTEVEHINIVEKDQDIIDLVWPHYDAMEIAKGRVTLFHEDIFNFKPNGIRYGAIWFDIWPTISQDNWDEMKFLHRRWGRHGDWKGSWCRHEIMKMNRQDREYRWH